MVSRCAASLRHPPSSRHVAPRCATWRPHSPFLASFPFLKRIFPAFWQVYNTILRRFPTYEYKTYAEGGNLVSPPSQWRPPPSPPPLLSARQMHVHLPTPSQRPHPKARSVPAAGSALLSLSLSLCRSPSLSPSCSPSLLFSLPLPSSLAHLCTRAASL